MRKCQTEPRNIFFHLTTPRLGRNEAEYNFAEECVSVWAKEEWCAGRVDNIRVNLNACLDA